MEKFNARNADLANLANLAAAIAATQPKAEQRKDDVEALPDWQLALVGGGENTPNW